MNLDIELLQEYAASIANEVAIIFTKKANISPEEFDYLKSLIKTEVKYAFSGLVENK